MSEPAGDPHEITQPEPSGAIGKVIPFRRRRTRSGFATRSANAPEIDMERFRADQDAAVDSELRDPYER
jgi:hypothetical protein